MSNLPQPKSPIAPDSPLREQRVHHRLVERLTDRLETPSLDDRSYRVIKLPNQLEVLLVHDAETDKASAAMDVNVGNFSDPEDFPGMAHAVEVEMTTSNAYCNYADIPFSSIYFLWEPKRYCIPFARRFGALSHIFQVD